MDWVTVLFAASGWLGWASKEILSALLKRRLARAGRLDVITGKSSIMFDIDSAYQVVLTVTYHDDMEEGPPYSSGRHFRLVIECQLTNDSDTQIVYTNPEIDFWGVEGRRMTHQNPSILVSDPTLSWRPSGSIVIEAHGITPVRLEMMPIASDFRDLLRAIAETYAGAVALLRVRDGARKEHQFRVITFSIAGSESVSWPTNLKYPIYNLRKLNADPRRAGKVPQERRTTEMRGASVTVAPDSTE